MWGKPRNYPTFLFKFFFAAFLCGNNEYSFSNMRNGEAEGRGNYIYRWGNNEISGEDIYDNIGRRGGHYI